MLIHQIQLNVLKNAQQIQICGIMLMKKTEFVSMVQNVQKNINKLKMKTNVLLNVQNNINTHKKNIVQLNVTNIMLMVVKMFVAKLAYLKYKKPNKFVLKTKHVVINSRANYQMLLKDTNVQNIVIVKNTKNYQTIL